MYCLFRLGAILFVLSCTSLGHAVELRPQPGEGAVDPAAVPKCPPPKVARRKPSPIPTCRTAAARVSSGVTVNCGINAQFLSGSAAPLGTTSDLQATHSTVVNCAGGTGAGFDCKFDAALKGIATSIDSVSSKLADLAAKPDRTAFTWIFSLVAALLSAVFAYVVSNRVRRDQAADLKLEMSNRRAWVFKLLRDEIDLRWEAKIGRDLRSVASNPDGVAAAIEFVKTIEMSPDDLIVFKVVASTFGEYHFIENSDLMSKIIYVHVLMRDLLDLRNSTLKAMRDSKGDPGADFLVQLRGLVKEIDSTMIAIRALIGQETV